MEFYWFHWKFRLIPLEVSDGTLSICDLRLLVNLLSDSLGCWGRCFRLTRRRICPGEGWRWPLGRPRTGCSGWRFWPSFLRRGHHANKWLSSRVWCWNNSHKVEQVLFTRPIRLVFCFKVAGALRRKQCYPLQCLKEATERIPRGIPWGASSLLYWWKEWPLQ